MEPKRRTICVVEDDPAIRRGIVDSLEYAGYRVVECPDGESARRTLLVVDLDLVLFDVVVPGMDGLEFLPELRAARPTLPVIFVTARGSEQDRVRGLTGGADDYVVKPFSATELLARVEAVLRRSAERPLDLDRVRVPSGWVDLQRHQVELDGADPAPLTAKESDLFAYLVRAAGRVISRSELLERVWRLNPRGVDTRTVDMAIARLREKLSDPAMKPRVILTVRGQGYRVDDSVLGEGA